MKVNQYKMYTVNTGEYILPISTTHAVYLPQMNENQLSNWTHMISDWCVWFDWINGPWVIFLVIFMYTKKGERVNLYHTTLYTMHHIPPLVFIYADWPLYAFTQFDISQWPWILNSYSIAFCIECRAGGTAMAMVKYW